MLQNASGEVLNYQVALVVIKHKPTVIGDSHYLNISLVLK
jgi:hypothetical protein